MLIVLILLGLSAGSFVNALVWRLQRGLPIAKARSICPNCSRTLAPIDLIPLISWLSLGGRCRYCRAKISVQYPLVEAGMCTVFILSYLFWPVSLSTPGQGLLLSAWLVTSVGLMALAIYDFRYMLLPNRLIYPSLAAAAAGQAGYTIFYSSQPRHHLLDWFLAILISSGLFWIIFMVSKGKWIGYGDVRLGLITGTILAAPSKAWAMLFFGSLLGSLIALPGLLRGQKNLNHKLPFGPLLIIATWAVLIWGQPVLDWYQSLLGA